jgi:hypothetical protein
MDLWLIAEKGIELPTIVFEKLISLNQWIRIRAITGGGWSGQHIACRKILDPQIGVSAVFCPSSFGQGPA